MGRAKMADAIAGHETGTPRLDRLLIRGVVAAVLLAFVSVIALFAINLGANSISPERYRKVVDDAVRNGTMAETLQQPFAPARNIHLVAGSDCQILAMLVSERDSPLKQMISPRWPMLPEEVITPPAPGYGRDEFCRLLARAMEGDPAAIVPTLKSHHRYLHAPVTLAALALAVVPLDVAQRILLVLSYGALAVLALAAGARMRAPEPHQRRRALAFLVFAAVLALFYAVSLYGRTFSHAPTDIVLVVFLLVGLLYPLCRMPERRFVVLVAAFGTAIALLELLTGGIPIALASLIALIALGEAPNRDVLIRRLVLGIACFAAAGVTCFVVKLVAVALVWGPGELAQFFDILGNRMGGRIGTWPALEQWAAKWGIDASVIDRSIVARWLLGGAMLTYSSFVLAWGSHLLGAALVIVPVPLLMVLTWVALRRVPRDRWLMQPQPFLLAAALVPIPWYALFTWHTATHSFFMVRPLALNVALAAIAALMLPPRHEPVAVHATASVGAE
jgi:hypothetical protein